jgi:predicted DsbA family dithiol-disulfide isomerase
LKQEFPLEDTWVSYEIHPETPPGGVLLERLFGPGMGQRQESMRRRCAALGLPFEPPRLLSNSRLVIEASEFARDAGKHHEFHRAALASYFARSQDIGDLDVLSELAAEIGLDPVALRQELAAGRYAGRRKAAHEEACGLGITGVPTFIFAGGARVVGAQPLDDFRRVLEGFIAPAEGGNRRSEQRRPG